MSAHNRPVQRRGRSRATWAACVAGALLLLAPGGATAEAASSGAPGLRAVHPNPQGYFEYRLSPGGEQVVDTAVVSNQGATAGDLLVYGADGYTSHVSGIVYGERSEPLRPAGAEGAGNGAGSWITPSESRLHLAPGSAVTISFTTAVPAGTAPGDYVAGLVAENPTPADVNGGGLRVTQRSVVAVVVHVPGTVHSGWSIGEPTISVENSSRQVITVPLASTGDVVAKPSLKGILSTCSGSTVVERLTRKLDTFLSHSRINYPINIEDRVLPAGCYTLALDFGEPGTSVHADRQLTISPPQAQVPKFVAPNGASAPTLAAAPAGGPSPLVIGLIGGVGVLLLGNLLALLLLRRRHRRPPEAADSGPPS
ncbi:MAG: hypothetical protein JWM18_852 [Chloroflexi bacterium]|nr:hypothetical protein [Chloroflexota bacterium]